jgi:hypothetical protein
MRKSDEKGMGKWYQNGTEIDAAGGPGLIFGDLWRLGGLRVFGVFPRCRFGWQKYILISSFLFLKNRKKSFSDLGQDPIGFLKAQRMKAGSV